MPTPHPSRCYDAPELLGRAQASITFGALLPDYRRVSMASLSITSNPTLFNKVRDHIFGKIVLRCIGRVQRFYDCWYVMHRKKKGNIIPTPSDWDDFIKYMRSTCSKDTSSTCGWRSDQHGGKIPDELKYMILFEKVSHRWIRNIHGLVHDIITERQKLASKKNKSHGKEPMNPFRLAILNLFDDFLLKSLGHSDKKNATKRLLGQTRFLSSKIMKDIEEDLEDIFWDCITRFN
jgi:hypothetical protein